MSHAEVDYDGGEAPKKKGGLIITVAAVLVLSLVGGGGGWVVGGMLAPEIKQKEEEAKKAAAEHGGGAEKKEGEEEEHLRPSLYPIGPITTNLSYPSDSWIRLELSLLFKENPDETLADRINEDILAYLRTVSLQQIEGPRGFEYLRDDIVERARLRSQGDVTDVIFRTFVIE